MSTPVGQLAEQVADRDDDRWLGNDPRLPVLDPGQLLQLLHAVPGPGLGQALVDRLALALLQQAVPPGPEVLDVHLGVPDIQVGQPGELPHFLPVARGRGERDLPAVLIAEPVLPRGYLQAGRQPLHVPLPGRGQRLVEVVDVEDQLALGRAEEAEVGQVRVPARLHDHPGRRGGGQVAGHGQGRAPVVGERGLHHPAVPHRDQVREPGGTLRLQQPDRVSPVGRRLPLGVALSRHLGSRRLAADPALGRGHPLPRRLQPGRLAAGQDHGPARPFRYPGGQRGGGSVLGRRAARGRGARRRGARGRGARGRGARGRGARGRGASRASASRASASRASARRASASRASARRRGPRRGSCRAAGPAPGRGCLRARAGPAGGRSAGAGPVASWPAAWRQWPGWQWPWPGRACGRVLAAAGLSRQRALRRSALRRSALRRSRAWLAAALVAARLFAAWPGCCRTWRPLLYSLTSCSVAVP